MNANPDRLYDLLPAVYRLRDADRGYPLRALLQVIAEQVNVVEADIAQLYDNWFIETCQEWVVPYLGDLVGYVPLQDAGEPGSLTPAVQTLAPRGEVANTIHYRRRKGTLSLLEELAQAAAGWPARAVELYRLLAFTQNLNCLRLDRGRTLDVRRHAALHRLNGPFDTVAHTVDVRRATSHRSPGRYNIPSIGVCVWRLRSYSVTKTQANCIDYREGCYTFSSLGNNLPLFTAVTPGGGTKPITCELDVPVPIRRSDFELRDENGVRANPAYYGPGKSVEIWKGPEPIGIEHIVPADLTSWRYKPAKPEDVAVDPQLGRMVFYEQPDGDMLVTYNYGFSTEMGGGEYARPLYNPSDNVAFLSVQTVSEGSGTTEPGVFPTLSDALAKAAQSEQPNVVIEIRDSGLYQEHVAIELRKDHSLQIRAANGARPVILIPDDRARRDAFRVTLASGARFTLDGVVVAGRGMQVRGPRDDERRGLVIIRHSTLVPGWVLDTECQPCCGEEPSIEVHKANCCIRLEHSICGSIFVNNAEREFDPVPIHIADSIVDATTSRMLADVAPGKCRTFHAISHEECGAAHAVLTICRSTIIGDVRAQAMALAENSIFCGTVAIERRQNGCVRFCYVPPSSQTPRRFECQPDLVEQAVRARKLPGTEEEPLLESERVRVEPEFNSPRYGTPTYCQLAATCAEEITRGAEDESEMGAFHDLFQPQRVANLRARLDEYTPAGMDAGIIFVS